MSSLLTTMEPGTLVDSQIVALAQAHELIIADFDEQRVKQACYELRASSVMYEVTAPKENKRIDVGATGYILRPHGIVTVIVQESIRLPNNVMARILTKGQLLSVGIQAVNTYADPGFEGRLGITLCNLSKRYLRITPGQPIAKIEFTVLPNDVAKPYAGQHGYETEIWPVPTQYFVDDKVLGKSIGIGNDVDELRAIYGDRIGDLAARVRFYERRMWIHLLVVLSTFTVLLFVCGRIGLVMSFAVGILSNLATVLAIHMAAKRSR